MVANITRIRLPLDFLLNHVLICYCRSEIFWTVPLCPLAKLNLLPVMPTKLCLKAGTSQLQQGSLQKGKSILVTGRGGPYGCETSRFPHFLDNRLTECGEVVSLKCRPPFTPQEGSWYSFLLEAESTPGP
jgi:hypothetical protein